VVRSLEMAVYIRQGIIICFVLFLKNRDLHPHLCATMVYFTSFLYSQLVVSLPYPTQNFTNQTIIVTGSNTGLGLEAVYHFSRLNASLVIMAVRNTGKGEIAKKSILLKTGRPSDSIEVWELDVQSFDSVKAFVQRVNKLSRVDAVLENAGIMAEDFKLVSGYESVITTKYVKPFGIRLPMCSWSPSSHNFSCEIQRKPQVQLINDYTA